MAHQGLTEMHDVAQAESKFVPECIIYSKRNLVLLLHLGEGKEGRGEKKSPEAAASKTILQIRAAQFVNY